MLERETGFEPATSTLARWHSTTELLPQYSVVRPPGSSPSQAWRSVLPPRPEAVKPVRPRSPPRSRPSSATGGDPGHQAADVSHRDRSVADQRLVEGPLLEARAQPRPLRLLQ